MPELDCIIAYLVCGFVTLAMLNLLLEVLGISLLGGDSKPGFIVRLILVILLSGGAGYALDTYLLDGEHGIKIKMHMMGGDDGDVAEEAVEEAADDMDAVEEAADDMEAVEEAVEEVADDMDAAMDDAAEAADDMVGEAVEEMADEAGDDTGDDE